MVDIQAIYRRGVIEFGEAQADRYHDDLESTFEMLATFVGAGQALPNVHPPTRIYPKAAHVVVYRHSRDHVEILRIFHQSEDWIDKLRI